MAETSNLCHLKSEDGMDQVLVSLWDELGHNRSLPVILADVEIAVLRATLLAYGWNRVRAGTALGLSRGQMYGLCKKHGLGRS